MSAVEATKNIWMKSECAVDHMTVTRWFKKFCSGYKNLNDQGRSGRPKTMNSESCAPSLKGKSSKENIRWASYSLWFPPLYNLSKKYLELLNITKILIIKLLQNFWLTLEKDV